MNQNWWILWPSIYEWEMIAALESWCFYRNKYGWNICLAKRPFSCLWITAFKFLRTAEVFNQLPGQTDLRVYKENLSLSTECFIAFNNTGARKNWKLEWLMKHAAISKQLALSEVVHWERVASLWHKHQARSEKWKQGGHKDYPFCSSEQEYIIWVFFFPWRVLFLAFALSQQAGQILSNTGISHKQRRFTLGTEIWWTLSYSRRKRLRAFKKMCTRS